MLYKGCFFSHYKSVRNNSYCDKHYQLITLKVFARKRVVFHVIFCLISPKFKVILICLQTLVKPPSIKFEKKKPVQLFSSGKDEDRHTSRCYPTYSILRTREILCLPINRNRTRERGEILDKRNIFVRTYFVRASWRPSLVIAEISDGICWVSTSLLPCKLNT